MTGEVVYIDDPLGRKICMAGNLCSLANKEINSLDLYDDLSSVIKNPALLIQTSDIPPDFFYFRSIGWNLSVLIRVKFLNHFWQAYKCTINPSDADIVELLKNGKQLI
jgi:hypothetical protein